MCKTMDRKPPTKAAGPAATSRLDLWWYDGVVLANLKDAEAGMSRSVWWVAVTMLLEVLVAFNGAQFRPGSTVPLEEAGLQLKAPGFALAILLPLLAGYWVLQAMHCWLSINTLTVVHYGTLETIAEQEGRDPRLYLFGRPLLPTVSFGGRGWLPRRAPSGGEQVLRQRVGTPLGAAVLVLGAAGLHAVVFAMTRPALNTWWLIAWLLAALGAAGFVGLALSFGLTFEDWKSSDTVDALRSFGATQGDGPGPGQGETH
jgi:hypothetical protein